MSIVKIPVRDARGLITSVIETDSSDPLAQRVRELEAERDELQQRLDRECDDARNHLEEVSRRHEALIAERDTEIARLREVRRASIITINFEILKLREAYEARLREMQTKRREPGPIRAEAAISPLCETGSKRLHHKKHMH
jgi:hypothetical protein